MNKIFRKIYLRSIIIIFTLFSILLLSAYCQEEDAIIEKVKNYVTSSGKTIGQIIDESVEKLIKMQKGAVSYGEPDWSARKAPLDMKGYIVSCVQGAVFYYNDKGTHGDGVRILEWYYDGTSLYAIEPNGLDKNMPSIKINKEFATPQ